MTREQAETAVAGSALIVAGIYAYRKLVEPSVTPTNKTKGGRVAQALGYGPPPPIGRFITGWGFTFLIVALMAQASPNFGGSFAILVAVGDVIGNGVALADDVKAGLGEGKPVVEAGGVPVYNPEHETPEQYDQRLFDYLLQHPAATRAQLDANDPVRAQLDTQLDRITEREQSPDPLIPGNPLGGSPFQSTTLR